jgi:murein DD-endopeptidase MepM/ murein hydrolase activator NlpD
MNYHFYSPIHKKNRTNNSMKFATDIVKVNSSKKTFLPPNNEDYLIFEEEVYCPMAGSIIKVENGIEDNIPYSGNYPYNTGNTVVIKNNDYYFLIGHLKKGSITVKLGDSVQQNDLIAKAGNSGYSERPHIHMQLISSQTDNYWKGLGVNISFQNKNLYKNRQIKT